MRSDREPTNEKEGLAAKSKGAKVREKVETCSHRRNKLKGREWGASVGRIFCIRVSWKSMSKEIEQILIFDEDMEAARTPLLTGLRPQNALGMKIESEIP